MELEVKELRIGNCITGVYYDLDSDEEKEQLCKVVSIDSVGAHEYPIMVDGLGNEIEEYQRLEPVPLTEEWLFKLGFEIVNHIDGYSFYSYKKKGKGGFCNITIYDQYTRVGNNTSVPHVKYVHQLQNLHFILTGFEVEV